MADMVFRLDRAYAETLVDRWPGVALERVASDEQIALHHALRDALDSPPIEEGQQYRVAGTNKAGEDWVYPLESPLTLVESKRAAADHETDWNVRIVIQSRTVTTFSDGSTFTSPWTDLPGEGESNDG